MSILTIKDVQELASFDQVNCISIFMNPHRMPNDRKKDRLIFKNFVDQVDHQLRSNGVKPQERKSILAPATKLLDDAMFWTFQSIGLAVYLTKDWCKVFRLPIVVGESAQIGTHFNVIPLLKYFDTNSRFFLLSLDQQGCKLYEGSVEGLLELDDCQFEEALKDQEFIVGEKQLQLRIGGSGGDGVMFHGHSESEKYKTRIREHFRQVDRIVQRTLQDIDAPLILAGVDYLQSIYREINGFPHLSSASIVGSIKDMDHDTLQTRALHEIKPVFKNNLDSAISRYHSAQESKRASSNADECLWAAYEGRVESLILNDSNGTDRYFQDTNSQVVTCDTVDEVLGRVATQTLGTGGKLYFVHDDNEITSGMGAILKRQSSLV